MAERIAIIGIGFSPLEPATPACSFKDSCLRRRKRPTPMPPFASTRSIPSSPARKISMKVYRFSMNTPRSARRGAKADPHPHSGRLHGIADALMQIRSGIAEIVAVEAHSKASNVRTPDWILDYALDPVYNRPLGLTPHAIAGLEMNRFLSRSGITGSQCAQVVVKNQRTRVVIRCPRTRSIPIWRKSNHRLISPIRCVKPSWPRARTAASWSSSQTKRKRAKRPANPCGFWAAALRPTVRLWNRAIGAMPNTPDSQLERLTVKRVLSSPMRSIFLKSTTPMPIRSCNI